METEARFSTRNAAIVFSLDDRFIAPAVTAMNSIHCCGGPLPGLSLVVLTSGLSSSGSDILKKYADRFGFPLSIRTVAEIEQLGNIERWAIPTCLRLFTGDVAAAFDRVLYLDADMFVQEPLAPLFSTDLGDKAVAAVINYPPFDVMRVAIRRSNRGSVNPDAAYFNAGVLLIDPQRWNNQDIGTRSREYLRRYPSTRLLDQDALNMVLTDNWHSLNPAWNAPAGKLDDMPMFAGLAQINKSLLESARKWEEVQKHAKILHFTGKPKPWEDDYPWPELRKRYYDFVPADLALPFPVDQLQTVEDETGKVKTRQFQRSQAQ